MQIHTALGGSRDDGVNDSDQLAEQDVEQPIFIEESEKAHSTPRRPMYDSVDVFFKYI